MTTILALLFALIPQEYSLPHEECIPHAEVNHYKDYGCQVIFYDHAGNIRDYRVSSQVRPRPQEWAGFQGRTIFVDGRRVWVNRVTYTTTMNDPEVDDRDKGLTRHKLFKPRN